MSPYRFDGFSLLLHRPGFRQKIKPFCLFILVLAILSAAGTESGLKAEGPRAGFQPLDSNGKMQISPQDRCPVCGMKVSKHAKFASAIQLKDQTTYYFCGTGCMIRTWMHPEIFVNHAKNELHLPVVQEYFTGQVIDARIVIWVAGSDVVGPMGPALVPVKDEAALQSFKGRHGGKTTFRLEEMNDEKWLQITGKHAVKKK